MFFYCRYYLRNPVCSDSWAISDSTLWNFGSRQQPVYDFPFLSFAAPSAVHWANYIYNFSMDEESLLLATDFNNLSISNVLLLDDRIHCRSDFVIA